jgi:hypothetical protein
MPNPNPISGSDAEKVRNYISQQDQIEYTGYKFLTLSGRMTLLFLGKQGQQRVLTVDHIKQLLR